MLRAMPSNSEQFNDASYWARASSLSRLHDHNQTHHTRQDSSGRVISPTQRIILDNTHTHTRQTSMPPAGFEPAIAASDRTHSHALDRAATEIGLAHRIL